MSSRPAVKAEQLLLMNSQEGVIIDVRTAMEHAEKHLARKHVHVPLDMLEPDAVFKRQGLDKNTPVYLLCRSGKRAQTAAEKFFDAGYDNVHVIEGGIVACETCGIEVKGRNTSAGAAKSAAGAACPIPLERQVRIAAGVMVMLGAGLALALNPLFSLIPLFAGAGLVFAGITDRCGMALVLTKAPWNKVSTEKNCCAVVRP